MSKLGYVGLGALVASAGLVVSVQAGTPGPIQAIYTKNPLSPTSVVPGAVDLAGDPVVTNFRAMESLTLSPDGSLWFIRARNQLGGDLETTTLMGSGLTGTTFVQEGQPVPDGEAGELVEFFGSGYTGQFNDDNHFAFALRARGGVASVFQKVIEWDGTTFTKRFQMGDLYTGLQDAAPNPSGDETVGNSIGSIHILNSGVIGSQDSSVLNISTTRRPVAAYNLNGFAQNNVTTVTNFAGDGIDIVTNIAAGMFYTTTDGSSYGYGGDVSGAPTNAVIINDKVALRQGQAIPGSTALFNDGNALRAHGTSIYVRGSTTLPTGGFLWRDDTLLVGPETAITNEVTSGPAETWVGGFSGFAANRKGDWVLAGKSNRDAAEDDVMVLNGTTVIVREGDPVDVDGNGMFDDDAFIGRGVNTNSAWVTDSIGLSDDGWVYFLANIRNGAGQDIQSNPSFGTPNALLRVRAFTPPPVDCPGDANGDNMIDAADLSVLLSNFGGPAAGPEFGDFNGDGQCDGADLSVLLSQFGTTCK